MNGLPPFVIRLLVAMGAIRCLRERPGLDKIAAFGDGVARQRRLVLSETKIVAFADLIVVCLAVFRLIRLGLGRSQCNAKCQSNHGDGKNSASGRKGHLQPECVKLVSTIVMIYPRIAESVADAGQNRCTGSSGDVRPDA